MRILLLSDTHNYLDDAILHYASEADEIWHAGDVGTISIIERLSQLKPVRAVYGNIDGRDVRAVYPLDTVFTIDGIRFWITHIGGYPNHYEPRVRKLMPEYKPDVFICGHSHILKVMRDPSTGILCMNPGAAGVHGFHKMRTMLRFSISEGKMQQLEAIEVGLRGKLKE